MTLPQKNHLGAANVQEARRALGNRLRELRKQAGLTGAQLAESLAWPPSKISKLENGHQTPTDDDIRGWAGATDAESEAAGLLASLHTLESRHAEWQRQFRSGLGSRQRQIAGTDATVRAFYVFEPATIPGLLQTADYARARFAEGISLYGAPNDIDQAVVARLQRQELLYDTDKRFHFVLTEAALQYRRCPLHVMLAQLDRLVSLSILPNVRLGIIARETQYTIGPWHGFWLRDNSRVSIETFSAELNLSQPQEVELYGKVFKSLAGIASYGREARAVITRCMDDLAEEIGEGSVS
jgi:transcriptional regulator with XRE-family HTH domain